MPPKGAPNVLLIMTDDQGYGVSGTFGGVIPTPALDRIAKAGLRYTCGKIMHSVRMRTLASILTDRGQTTIPAAVRKALKLKPRQRLFYEIRDEGVFIRPERGKPIDLAGYLKSEVTVGSKGGGAR